MLLIAILFLLSFLQSTFINIDLVLLIIICRSLIMEDQKNYYLAFGVGLLLAYLTEQPLGIVSIFSFVVIRIVYLLTKTALGNYWLIVIPLVAIIYSVEQLIEQLFFQSPFDLKEIIILAILSLPIYLLMKIWEERFIPKKEIRLKLGK